MSNKAKIREEAKKLNPIDDLMFRKMAEEKGFCEEILRVILSDPALSVLGSTPQYAGTNPQGRSVILDAKCVLGNGRQIDIEVQKSNDTDHQRRVRYNGAVLTTNLTDPGEKFENIPDVCVVFISRFDIFNSGHSLYHVDRIIRETGKTVDNGFTEIYVNAKVKDGSAVAELMEVFVNDSAYSSKFPVTSGSKRRYKETEKGQQIMCEIMEKIAREERNEGRMEGETRINTLNSILIKLDRLEDLKRAAYDKDFQMQLMIELLPEES
ncbi:MAG: Rpn family recombination-promoting nuclease/putative transposase [Muribaculaceae bacterium]|nr:Rpn family recombination-promoting nuclease/putative transposase [Roseburia sp.]MCM1429936.1 Rpn family recombination-promoting nuclease/putative transposase [Muribaculaceae bacterium]MCM1493037.1 Rpn family recombination-promoting nuclease/putative transposase [Muribaculaceae bacterium]